MIEGLGILLTRTTAPPPTPVMMPDMGSAGPSAPGTTPSCHGMPLAFAVSYACTWQLFHWGASDFPSLCSFAPLPTTVLPFTFCIILSVLP